MTHLRSRQARAGNCRTLDYQFTVDDPTAFTKPWSADIPMSHSDGALYEYACHEGNYAMTDILAGARTQEKSQR